MPYFGINVASASFLSAPLQLHLAIAGVILAAILVACHSSKTSLNGDEITSLPCNSLFVISPFFRRRFDFFNWGFSVTGQQIFQFRLLKNKVFAISGETNRRIFFTQKALNLTEGFALLSGAIPMVPGITSGLEMKKISLIHKRLAMVQKDASLNALIPTILEDIRTILENKWGTSGNIDPFESIYEVMFRVTLRTLTCCEITDDEAVASRLRKLYDVLDANTTPSTVVVPWLPLPAMVRKLIATKEIYDIVTRAIRLRQRHGMNRDDTLQMLMDQGDNESTIVGFIMGLIIAGARATGTTASWLHTYLGNQPFWQQKAREEVETMLARHLEDQPTREEGDPANATFEQLARIPLDVWETQTPVIDSIIRETLRVAQPHTAMRRNMGPEFFMGDKRIPEGAYLMYPFSNVHLDEDLYPDPWRFAPDRPEPTKPFSFVGWGAGKTLWQGTRMAKLELKLTLASLLMKYRWKTVGKEGNPLENLPKPNWNDTLTCRPPKGLMYLRYSCKVSDGC